MADLVAAAERVAAEVLAPGAEEVDRAGGVPRSRLDALAAAGLFGLVGPTDHGGAAAPSDVVREVYEAVAGACGNTFFSWVQHHFAVRLLATSANEALQERYLADLCSGRLFGGASFAYLRRPGPPAVAAEAVDGGWCVRGEAPWVTSWGLADLLAVSAGAPDGRVVSFVLPAREGGAVQASAPLRLAAMGATSTVRLAFDDLFVPDDDVAGVVDAERWRAADRVTTAQPTPAAFGVAATCCRLLAERVAAGAGPSGGGRGPGRWSPAVAEAATRLDAERRRSRDHAYHLADLPMPPPGNEREAHLSALVDARAWGLDVAQRAAAALVAAAGGRAMELDHPAQRLLREATFYSIQAQTEALREATLERLLRR